MKSNKVLRIAAAAMTAAMLAAAVPVSAAALPNTSNVLPVPYPEVVYEGYGDGYGPFSDIGTVYSDNSYIIQNPMVPSRSINKWPFEFSVNVSSDPSIDNGMGNGVCNTFSQRILYHGGTSYTYIDDKGKALDFWYDERTSEGYSPIGKFRFEVEEYRYKLKFDDGNEKWFDRATGWMNVYYVNSSLDDATAIYRDPDGYIEYILAKDASRYDFYYDTLADGSRRVSRVEYAENYSGLNRQVISFRYDADGNLTDINNDTDIAYARGYSYTYSNGKLVNARSKASGNDMAVVTGPDGNTYIDFIRN